jgi:hypothetical protein
MDEIKQIESDLNKVGIELLRYKSFNKMIYYKFLMSNNFIKIPDVIGEIESIYLSHSYRFGLKYSIGKYHGNIIKYDVNGFYQYYSIHKEFIIGHKTPSKHIYLSTEELYKSNIKIGYYNCKIERSSDKNINKLFRFGDDYDCYYYYDLKCAIMLGLKITMYENNNNKNCLLFDKGEWIFGKSLFYDYITDLYKDKIDCNGIKNKTIKAMLSIVQGLLSEKIHRKEIINDLQDGEELNENEIIKLDIHSKFVKRNLGKDKKNKIYINENQFKTRYGRCSCINSFTRYKLAELLFNINKKYNSFLDDVLYIAIDSIVLKNPEIWKERMKEFITIDKNELGAMKIEKEGVSVIDGYEFV